MNTTDWHNCYPSNWKGVIVTEAMSHPAKYSSKLIRRIYEHMLEMDWLKPGDRVVDPFGGVALGALDAMRLGLDWTGIELESKFAGLGYLNINQWNVRYGNMPRWGCARLINGDSRRLLELLPGSVDVALSSPPYAESIQTSEKGSGIDYSKAMNGGKGRTPGREAIATGYGSSAGQLSSMREGGFAGAVSSPPFGSQQTGQGIAAAMRGESDYSLPNNHTGKHGYQEQGEAIGNLASMDMDGFHASISSPPYENVMGNDNGGNRKDVIPSIGTGGAIPPRYYGDGAGQLGNDSGNNFWLAARTIVEQVYLSLTPGGHAVWVVKDYVKNKQIVPFSDQWRQLCEAVGFVTMHEHHAMLVHHKGSQHTLDGGMVEHKTESKSFFRRLAEKKGSPRIDYETVYCMVRGAQ